MTTELKSLSIASRAIIDMHALNNEGSESNRLMTREVGIVTPEYENGGYRRSVVNAISGDMNKHIFADAFRHIALDMGLPLCPACADLDPGRMMANEPFKDYVEDKDSKATGADIVDRLISCALDDVAGILITAGSNSVKRKSAVEFGWTVGLPDITKVEEFIHARHAVRRVTRTTTAEDQEQAQKEKEANTGQMVFNRPASSGVYAFVLPS